VSRAGLAVQYPIGPSFRPFCPSLIQRFLSTSGRKAIHVQSCLHIRGYLVMQSIHPQLRAATRLSARALRQARRQELVRCLTTTFADPEVATAIDAGQKVSALHDF